MRKDSSQLTSNPYALIGVEKLKTKNMTQSAKRTAAEHGKNVHQKAVLNKAMLDASPARLILLTYKAERTGWAVVKVDKTLAERVHRCACGAVLNRDANAARNILQRALVAGGLCRPGTVTWGIGPYVVSDTQMLTSRKRLKQLDQEVLIQHDIPNSHKMNTPHISEG